MTVHMDNDSIYTYKILNEVIYKVVNDGIILIK